MNIQNINMHNNIFIITRFNLNLSEEVYANHSFRKSLNIDDEYLTKRFELFEKYCIPSIQAQTNKDFYWLVLFNTDTPEYFKQKIQLIKENIGINFEPIYMEKYDITLIHNKIIELKDDSNWITSIRLDNDDILSKDFINTVMDTAQKINKTAINFEQGLHFNLKTHEIGIHNPKSNHYLTYIENISKNFELVYKCNHGDMEKSGIEKYINIKNKPMWVELIHDCNVANEFTSCPIAVDENILDFINNFSDKNKKYKLFHKTKFKDKTMYFFNIFGIRIKYTKRFAKYKGNNK